MSEEVTIIDKKQGKSSYVGSMSGNFVKREKYKYSMFNSSVAIPDG